MLINEKTTIAVRRFLQGAICVYIALYNAFSPAIYQSGSFMCGSGSPAVQTSLTVPGTGEDTGEETVEDTVEDTVDPAEAKAYMTEHTAETNAVRVTTAFVPDNTVCEIIGDTCALYDTPDCTGAPVEGLEGGSEVIRTGIGSGVDRIVTEDGLERYVAKYCAIPSSVLEQAQEDAEAQAQAETITPGQQIADIAVSMIGTPYLYAGASENGVDCSGLVVYCYAQLGVDLPHYSGSLCSVGEEVAIEDIMPGDIICWNNGGGHCGHVGLYVGDGQCVDARGHRDGVTYADLDLHPILTVRRIFTE